MVKSMKKLLRYSLIFIVVIGLAGVVAYKWIEYNFNQLAKSEVTSLQLSSVSDGEYKGTYQSFPIDVEVNVTVVDHKITTIDLIKHVTGQGQSAEGILDEVVKQNSIDVDVISGATYSSKVILQAISNALNNKN